MAFLPGAFVIKVHYNTDYRGRLREPPAVFDTTDLTGR